MTGHDRVQYALGSESAGRINCHDGLIGGALLGGGATAVWEALKNDHAREIRLTAPQ